MQLAFYKPSYCLAILCFLFYFGGTAQSLDLRKCHDWKVYRYNKRDAASLSTDSLETLRSQKLDDQSARFFFVSADTIDKFRTPVWMGMIVGSCRFRDTTRLIIFSTYGGFFWDKDSKRYYQISREKLQQWNSFFAKLIESVNTIDQ